MTSPADERRVVVGVDGSEPSRLALQWAQFMAHALTATVDAVRVWEISAVEATEWSDDWDPEKEAGAALHTTVTEVLGSPPSRAAARDNAPGQRRNPLLFSSGSARMSWNAKLYVLGVSKSR